ncbi:phosphopantetheine-binding protein [Mangrovicoccus sp. HB161399]|uniref:phosphopantetheine-binding protein n=1 Tax=Mangrovicoccus sp. HB161399 TaxID=2720392 RepID=UPI001C130F4D|nr:phosphopantetheine-binding protein [Mangrovicoccus sp. HB161399]
MTAPAPLTRAWLEARVAALVEDVTEIDPGESLIFYGLDSIRVMEFSAELGQHGVALGFEELATEPTLDRWWQLIGAQLAAA